ncbi:uncharacterized protein MYCFIDRAFT_211003 [Pseudocercospora fijiensis CIRAD86]|uniref:Uncharacterized protein n=1 Tax=Pseudocercospora fijiensis (strain CIRAD86) TaxID=383855 RepID=M3A159_PSEFD|nr:uncharacterized protein MYCFIDRAFT_211003 [Pseudocercospora fijiensis CIRAD86]EME84894.1 hypothetical protein MYCFIDRAFT_211003 [Pseudocercospora fijiensis CIRAD86]
MSVTKTYQRTLCLCGNQRFEAEDWCPECVATSRRSHPKSSPIDMTRKQYFLAPPPSTPTSPGGMKANNTPITHTSLSRPFLASEPLTNAMSYEDNLPSMFPSTTYRLPDQTRTTSDGGRSLQPISPTSPPAIMAISKSPRAATPEMRSPNLGGYAPMAAGFARLGRNSQSNSMTDMTKLRRPVSARPSLDLEARMFSGPA